ncbi:NADPH-dependent FMN reductase [Paenibacillus thalictri]|uniref:NADPH-dependent oxidoreductase n=1 Tax=Paenibacillus thalictri TaxID=2527873 RepID=A0A4Q9DZL6_9BACL|nr:NADPH-dependent FMN reductase [Paenibacillus thalictri]TBL81293.1 NADPH-dependent oxidoreductase [Paenibacillus thalictri]
MKITIIAGSNRENATSTMLCRYMARVLEEMGCSVNLFELYHHPLPLYAPKVECADPNVRHLERIVKEADGVILATPDYHGSLSGVLKNALDYLGFDHFDGKIVLSASSSGGAVGVSPLTHLQTVVRNVHGINCPEWISIGGEFRRFTPEGEPEHEKTKERIARALQYFLRMVQTFAK